MLRRLIVVTALAAGMSVAAITLASPALAKGPSQARITGPGLVRAIVVSAGGNTAQQARLSALAVQTSLFTVLFGAAASVPPQTPARLSTPPPKGSLGPRYTIIYTVPGVTPQPGQQLGRIRQDLYPRAAGRSSTHHQASPASGSHCKSPGGSVLVPSWPAPSPGSGLRHDWAWRQCGRAALPRIQRQDINRVHRPLPGSSHQERPLAPQRPPAARWCCVTRKPAT